MLRFRRFKSCFFEDLWLSFFLGVRPAASGPVSSKQKHRYESPRSRVVTVFARGAQHFAPTTS
ncbi:hypothetical protein K443DRAFT_678886, partial [Laccaria amethystina LaAM-08-1]